MYCKKATTYGYITWFCNKQHNTRRDDHDEDDDRHGGRDAQERRAVSRAPRGRSRSRHGDSPDDRHRSYSSRYGDGQGGRRQALLSPTFIMSFLPPSPTPAPSLTPEPFLSDAEVSEKLEDMFRVGLANLRSALPILLGVE